jgi:hypothetical protein
MRNTADVRITMNPGEDMTSAEVDTLTGSLRQDLLELDLASVDRPAVTDLPDGAKSGTAQTVGVLVASGVVSASTVKAIASVATAWIKRAGARSVTIERGKDRIEITGTSKDHVNQLVDKWFEGA